MDLRDPNRLPNRKPFSSTERLLGVPSHAPPLENPTSSTADEFIEDDVVFFDDDYTEPGPSYNHASSSSFSPITNHHHHHNHKGFRFGSPDAFGILAALPGNDASPNSRNGSHFFRKASASASVSASASLSSSASSSSSRLIPAIPRPPSDRIPSSVKFHQSAPVNVPISSPAMLKASRRRRDADIDDDSEEAAEDEEMLPPHEIVERNSAQSPMLAYSVLEGVGRTLKGRDLRQVRNAVWRQTGFLG
ncbi:protein S40-7-like [Gastrolobium bilobum]|uniref:protein S40-7-like n=1 Tax=Gastrolobium bilobum TaxID=150636 RepID=UPI002AB1EE63|nr:protein S40-7-like [Gastrolobium bilobum]